MKHYWYLNFFFIIIKKSHSFISKGIKAPFWFRDTMINTIGFRESEKALQLGKMYSPEEALSIGLVDEIVEPINVLTKAEEEMQKWCKIPSKFFFKMRLKVN